MSQLDPHSSFLVPDSPLATRSSPLVPRHDGRLADELRPLKIERAAVGAAPGRVLISAGNTVVLCTASIDESVPPWLKGKGRGWITAEYSMLPGSTSPRKPRDRSGKLDGRASEIQRLIGRSLRSVADLQAFGERTLTVDCDVLQADGGTRTASITGALVAAVDAIRAIPAITNAASFPLRESVAAISVGIVAGAPLLDLDYQEDVAAEVDTNIVMTASGRFVEIQAAGEEATFDEAQLTAMLALARKGIRELVTRQRQSLGEFWPW